MSSATISDAPAPPAGAPAPLPFAGADGSGSVREILARTTDGSAEPSSGWVMRQRTTSPLETRYVTR
jgi:hypothetical protein